MFQIEDEIRTQIPITYLNIWDDLPAPMYNQEFYDSCDALFGISKQTKNINEMVLGDKAKDKVIKYIPHGLDHFIFRPINKFDKEYKKLEKLATDHIDDLYKDKVVIKVQTGTSGQAVGAFAMIIFDNKNRISISEYYLDRKFKSKKGATNFILLKSKNFESIEDRKSVV